MTINPENIIRYKVGRLRNGQILVAQYESQEDRQIKPDYYYPPYWVICVHNGLTYWLHKGELTCNIWLATERYTTLEEAVQAGIAYLEANDGTVLL